MIELQVPRVFLNRNDLNTLLIHPTLEHLIDAMFQNVKSEKGIFETIIEKCRLC